MAVVSIAHSPLPPKRLSLLERYSSHALFAGVWKQTRSLKSPSWPPCRSKTTAHSAASPAAKRGTRPAAGDVSIARRRLNVMPGRRALVSGHVAGNGAGRAVALERRGRGGRWHTVGRARTAAAGAFRLRFRPRRSGSATVRVRSGPVHARVHGFQERCGESEDRARRSTGTRAAEMGQAWYDGVAGNPPSDAPSGYVSASAQGGAGPPKRQYFRISRLRAGGLMIT